MDVKEITRWIAEEMDETDINAVIFALVAGFDRVNPEGELVCLALPKFNQVERKRILDDACRMILQTSYDKETGKPMNTGF